MKLDKDVRQIAQAVSAFLSIILTVVALVHFLAMNASWLWIPAGFIGGHAVVIFFVLWWDLMTDLYKRLFDE